MFDIDGTLTPSPSRFVEARPDAAHVAGIYSAKGYEVIYLSARPDELETPTKEWLELEGFPHGVTFLSETSADRDNPREFKTRILNELVGRGCHFNFAYGDSSTDFEAYAAAKIPKNHVFALRRAGAAECQPGVWEACLGGWTEHLPFVEGR